MSGQLYNYPRQHALQKLGWRISSTQTFFSQMGLRLSEG
jgi:hypothetical protein